MRELERGLLAQSDSLGPHPSTGCTVYPAPDLPDSESKTSPVATSRHRFHPIHSLALPIPVLLLLGVEHDLTGGTAECGIV